jgi:hypothetical protein
VCTSSPPTSRASDLYHWPVMGMHGHVGSAQIWGTVATHWCTPPSP